MAHGDCLPLCREAAEGTDQLDVARQESLRAPTFRKDQPPVATGPAARGASAGPHETSGDTSPVWPFSRR